MSNSHSARFTLRVATDPAVGGGHASRCAALAGCLSSQGSVLFVVDDTPSIWHDRLVEAGYSVSRVSAHNFAGLNGGADNAVILDHYSLTPAEREKWRTDATVLVGFDDLNQMPEQYDLRIVPNPLTRQASSREVVLSGVEFIPLAPSFRGSDENIRCKARHCVVGFGLRDSRGGSLLAVNALKQVMVSHPQLHLTCMIGSASPHLAELTKLMASMNGKAKLIVDAEDVPSILRTADFTVGGGGISLFERMCLGLPCIVVTNADNQEELAKWIGENAGALVLGNTDEVSTETLADAIHDLMNSHSLRQQLAVDAKSLVDGNGSLRISDAIIQILAAKSQSTAAPAK